MDMQPQNQQIDVLPVWVDNYEELPRSISQDATLHTRTQK